MMDVDAQEYTLDQLNRLYAAEKRSLFPRLMEMGVFVQWARAHEMDQVRRMTAEQALAAGWLAEAAAQAGGALDPACADVHTANLHYCSLRSLLPAVLASVEQLVAIYAEAMTHRAGLTTEAAQTVARIYNRHQVQLEQLKAMQARLESKLPA